VPLRETAWATLRKFQVSSQFTQSGHCCHITEEIENLLRIFCNWLILSKLAGKFRIYSQFSVLSYSLVHCAFPGSLIKMSSPGKLGFVPSVCVKRSVCGTNCKTETSSSFPDNVAGGNRPLAGDTTWARHEGSNLCSVRSKAGKDTGGPQRLLQLKYYSIV